MEDDDAPSDGEETTKPGESIENHVETTTEPIKEQQSADDADREGLSAPDYCEGNDQPPEHCSNTASVSIAQSALGGSAGHDEANINSEKEDSLKILESTVGRSVLSEPGGEPNLDDSAVQRSSSPISEHSKEENTADKADQVEVDIHVAASASAKTIRAEHCEDSKIENEVSVTKDTADAGSGAEMSMSEDEGEIQEDDEQVSLEQAKARLLAQLGDRLVQPKPGHTPKQSLSSAHSSRGPKQRHNGNFCTGVTCAPSRLSDRRHTSHQFVEQGTSRGNQRLTGSYPLPNGLQLLSREQAEVQRQQLREQKRHLTGKIGHETREQEELHLRAEPRPILQDPSEFPFLEEAQDDKDADGQSDETEDVDFEEASVSPAIDVEIPDLNSRVTVDMILTVVAECYGQKDLLRFRDGWF